MYTSHPFLHSPALSSTVLHCPAMSCNTIIKMLSPSRYPTVPPDNPCSESHPYCTFKKAAVFFKVQVLRGIGYINIRCRRKPQTELCARHFDITFIYSILNLVRGGADTLWATYRIGAYVVKNLNALRFKKTHRSLPFSGRSRLF